MRCSEKGCPYPARQDGICVKHLQDRTLEASTVGGSIPLCQEYAMVEDAAVRLSGNGGQRAGVGRHRGSYGGAEL
jgi:hypothetical protein